tara:strand:- start:1036 stop:2166 length:1131 start_codon:yes stop_codon:yes gene_type:complete
LKNKKINIGFFISDDGYGHAARQSSIISYLLKNNKKKKFQIHVYGNKIIKKIKNEFKNKIKYQKFDNIIQTKKNFDGSLSLSRTKKIFSFWKKNKKVLIKKVKSKVKKFDLLISDSVPHVFDAANELNIKALNISHFTWDWFYLKTFKRDMIYNELVKSYKKSDKFIFPPLTDPEILKIYKNKVHKVNFIVTDSFVRKRFPIFKRKKISQCIIMDNGSRVLSTKILKIIKHLKEFNDLNFIISANSFDKNQIQNIKKIKNCKIEKDLKSIHKYIPQCDFLIARGGFNTITECLILKKPTILYNETKNIEVKKNISFLVEKGLSYPINREFFTNSFKKKIDYFRNYKLNKINKIFLRYKFKGNGSDQAGRIIISCLS